MGWGWGDLPCKHADRLLFNASTIITIRNGEKAQLWTIVGWMGKHQEI
jgi:hypothetical protein